MDKYLVIVESPTKAKTIRKFLPKNYIVEASMGHVRDLPQSASDIPAKLKKEEWAKLGVNVKKDFEPLYVIPKGKNKIVTSLRKKMKECEAIYLATDEDREGESISWHLMELLKPKIPVKRMVFHEITKSAINKALEDTRELDEQLVKAQEARRILDRLYGYTLSPLIWKKIAYGLSAGRVQSTGLRFIIERERERRKFVKSEYWDLKASLQADKKDFEAKLTYVSGKRVASGKDFDPDTGKLTKKDIAHLNEKEAKELQNKIESGDWKVTKVEEKESKTHPTKPFITSSLQMEGVRKLGMSAKQTMRTAQKLYEEGLITYMRTDSPNLSKEAINGARSSVEELFGKDYLSDKVRNFAAKTKGAQEAHEAIRPAGAEFTHPDKTGLTGKEKQLYELIWKRTLASQMKEATKANMQILIEVDGHQFNANGSRIVFPGFLRVYVEGSDDPDKALDDKEVILPTMKEGQSVKCSFVEALSHETKPPARFTEASLVQRLEKEGVGRPSTYASIIATIQDRGYVRKEGTALIPTFTGMAVVQLLEKYFDDFVDYGFTSEMEEKLDLIATGEVDYLKYLKEFYSGKKGLKNAVEAKEKSIVPDESRTIHLGGVNGEVDVKVGRFGPYIISHGSGKDEVHASIPEDIAPADLKDTDIDELIELSKRGPEPIGTHPESGEPIYCLVGRYGPYLQLGEATEENPKPRRASLPKGTSPKNVEMDVAVKLLSLPRELGLHPETKKMVAANIGRFGPYVMHDGEFRSIKKDDDVYEIELPRALEILAQPKFGRGGDVLKDFGKLEEVKKSVKVLDGKYGVYIKAGTKNISVPDEFKDVEKAKKITKAQVLKIVKEALE
ncbi:MAG: DNA topoisomerase I [Halobacteriovoraceae bacterium]|nr:DNA topoisomerase I [Halobacteriovoraceae bacterium]|tara:strand:- start:12029 stop:14566 length:2538 start_codon:yes stop_codon:yes gene_type:complete